MTDTTLSMFERVRLEKAATDAGFDVRQEASGGWLEFGSTSSPLRVCLTVLDTKPVAALSMSNVLAELGVPTAKVPVLPLGAVAAFVVPGFGELQAVLSHAYELANALPTALLQTWNAKMTSLPATEREATVRQRVGQDLFRQGLLALWHARCALTGMAVPELLRASHAKPWRDATDEERLDVYNGVLLAAHLDAAFDAGLISFAPSGDILVSPRLGLADRAVLGLDRPLEPISLRPQHARYMAYHRDNVFQVDFCKP